MKTQATYARKEIMETALLPAAAFEHFTRTGVLEAIPGTDGNRQHRRFSEAEFIGVNILATLWHAGVGAPDLAPIAKAFRDAVAWFTDHEMVGFESLAELAITMSGSFHSEGRVQARHVANYTDAAGMKPFRRAIGWYDPKERLSLNDIAEALQGDSPGLSKSTIDKWFKVKRDNFETQLWPYWAVSGSPQSIDYVRRIHFNRVDGHWKQSFEDPDDAWIGYFTIDVKRLKKRILPSLMSAKTHSPP